jgi:hypothetical protein
LDAQTLQHAQGLGFILIDPKGAQQKKKLEEARLLIKPNPKTKLPQTHLLKNKNKFLKMVVMAIVGWVSNYHSKLG